MKLRQFLDERAEVVARMFHDIGRINRMYHVVDGEGRQVIMPAPPGDKDTSVAMTRVMFEVFRVRRYVMFDEGWTVMSENPGEADLAVEHARTRSLETFPGRKEVLLIVAEDEDEGQIMASREIIRPARGKARLGPLEVWDTGVSEGRMVGLLPSRGTRQ